MVGGPSVRLWALPESCPFKPVHASSSHCHHFHLSPASCFCSVTCSENPPQPTRSLASITSGQSLHSAWLPDSSCAHPPLLPQLLPSSQRGRLPGASPDPPPPDIPLATTLTLLPHCTALSTTGPARYHTRSARLCGALSATGMALSSAQPGQSAEHGAMAGRARWSAPWAFCEAAVCGGWGERRCGCPSAPAPSS